MSLEEIIRRYKTALPEGTFFHFPISIRGEHTGVHSWVSTFLPGPLGGGAGYGLNAAQAEVGSLGELHERLQSLWVVPSLALEKGSYHDLTAAYGIDAVVNPVALGLPAGSPHHADQPRFWVEMQRYPEGVKWVLLEAAASSPAELPAGYDPLFLPVSNGLGAGLNTARGLLHGLLEVLQRDGNSVRYRALDQGHVLDLSESVPDEVSEVLQQLRTAGFAINVKLAATDFGLVNLYVNGYLDAPTDVDRAAPVVLAACGEACDLDRAAALRKALLEFAFSRVRLAFSHAPLEVATQVSPPGYLGAHRAHFKLGSEEARALRAMAQRLAQPLETLKAALAPTYQEARVTPFSALPARPDLAAAPSEVRLREVVTRLGEFEVLYLELTTPRAQAQGVRAVKVVVPGLEVETASYGRIGARNVERLLARGSDLVGLGSPPPGAARVHLTAEAEARLGGPAWFHLARLEQTVGSLYPLYREPARHTVRYAQEVGA